MFQNIFFKKILHIIARKFLVQVRRTEYKRL
jgi:hypothetical protein